MKMKFQLVLICTVTLLFVALSLAEEINSDSEMKEQSVRTKRTLQYFLEGVLTAFAEKRQSLSPLTTILNLSKFSQASRTKNKKQPSLSFSSEEDDDISSPIQFPIPQRPSTTMAPSTTSAQPTKPSLPLLIPTTASSTTTATMTTTTASSIEISSAESSSEEQSTTEDMSSSTENIVDSTTVLSTDSGENTTPSILSNEIPRNEEARAAPLYNDPAKLKSPTGRHTQFFGNPMILERHQGVNHIPLYSDDIQFRFANALETQNQRAPKLLPATQSTEYFPQHAYTPQLFILPMAFSFERHRDLAQARSDSVESHSHVDIQSNGENYYSYRGTGAIPVPIVNLRPTHIDYINRRRDCE